MVRELFETFKKGEFPMNGGYIVSAFFHDQSMYSKFEMISYSNVKDIYPSDEGITFQADGQKIFWLVEPSNYPSKATEPTYRTENEKIPYRMNEVEVFTTKRQDRVLIGKKPVFSYTSFTVMQSQGQNYSYIFFMADDIVATMQNYFTKSLYEQAGVPNSDAKKVAQYLTDVFKMIIVKTPE
ncbi:MAG: transposase [Spirochaetales bacterium]|nr:transposase [Spirochaetales bacterium]